MDFENYKNNMSYPERPRKPSISIRATPKDHREYADKLEVFEKEQENYKEMVKLYSNETNRLKEQFKKDLFIELGIQDNPKKEKLWNIVYNRCGGDQERYELACDLVELIAD